MVHCSRTCRNTSNTDETDAFNKIVQSSNSFQRWEGEDRAVPCTHLGMGPSIREDPPCSIRAGAGTGSASLLPPRGQPVGTWEWGTSCGGLCLLAQVTPLHFHVGELGKKFFRSTSAFGIPNLLVAASSPLSSARMKKASWAFFQIHHLQQSADEELAKIATKVSPGPGHPKSPGIQMWVGPSLCTSSGGRVAYSLLLFLKQWSSCSL